MKINIRELERIIRKATVSYMIDFVRLELTKDNIKARLIGPSKVISLLDVPNTVIPEMSDGDEIEFNWLEPNVQVMPYIRLFEEEEVDLKIAKQSMTIKDKSQKSKINFSMPQTNAMFGSDAPNAQTYYFTDIVFDDTFMEAYNKIKKIGTQHQKIYFTVEDGKLYIEATDKTNVYANQLRFEIADVDTSTEFFASLDSPDFFLCFDYKNFTSVMMILDDPSMFKLKLSYKPAQQAGIAYIIETDADEDDISGERYIVMSKNDIAGAA